MEPQGQQPIKRDETATSSTPSLEPTTTSTAPTSTASPVSTPVTAPAATPAPVTVTQPASVTQGAASNNTALYVVIAVLGTLLVAVLLFFLLGSGKKDTDSSQTVAPTTSTPEKATTTDNQSAEPAAPAASAGDITLGKTIVDDVMGYTITAESMSIDKYKIPEKYQSAQAGKSVVAVTYKITDNNKYGRNGKNVYLSVRSSDGLTNSDVSSLYADQLKANGTNSLSDATESNDTVTGTQIYHIKSATTDKLTLTYKRFAANIIGGGGGTIPAQEFTVELR
ncbi:MAG: hypothetical protein QG629_110 [Patescibacteria group bacterium]|nr:hypothetical protein [Candidatus Saccharibacteria bacterium]MDQ5963028.1 hypothetical protein [Patescibacteria group bacterium]